jgi:UDP-3-O-[3-hydroxymyristoyl] glucosamine N-acyltransferase
VLRCTDPYAAVTLAIIAIHGHRKHPRWPEDRSGGVSPTARIGRDANIAPSATVAAGATLGDDCTLYPGCYVGEGARLGDGCVLYPNVVVYDHCVLGNRVTLHAGTVIGQDGLGYAPVGDRWLKIPQVGIAVIGDDVELGANCSVDRATLGRTEVASGTKMGNGCVIGHGTYVGPNCLFVGQVGIAGSTRVGANVTLGGQVGVVGHLEIGDRVRAAAQSGISSSVPADTEVMGMFAIEASRARRIAISQRKLPELLKRMKAVERELVELHAALGSLLSRSGDGQKLDLHPAARAGSPSRRTRQTAELGEPPRKTHLEPKRPAPPDH